MALEPLPEAWLLKQAPFMTLFSRLSCRLPGPRSSPCPRPKQERAALADTTLSGHAQDLPRPQILSMPLDQSRAGFFMSLTHGNLKLIPPPLLIEPSCYCTTPLPLPAHALAQATVQPRPLRINTHLVHVLNSPVPWNTLCILETARTAMHAPHLGKQKPAAVPSKP